MSARIEVAEVLSFRLKVPKAELERLAQGAMGAGASSPDGQGAATSPESSPSLPGLPGLIVENEAAEWVLSVEEGDSILRFRTIGTEAVLTEVVLCNDERGMFFTRLLGPLMVSYGGDLSARLTWNVAERNTDGEFAEVKIVRGKSTFPGLGSAQPTLASGTTSTQSVSTSVPVPKAEPEAHEPPQPTPEQREVQMILERARGHWEEYLRLKAASARNEK